MSSFSENQIVPVVLQIIRNNPGIRTSDLIEKARAIMRPSGDDLTILADRNDDKFSQKVRNIKSHDSIADQVVTTSEKNRQWFLKDGK